MYLVKKDVHKNLKSVPKITCNASVRPIYMKWKKRRKYLLKMLAVMEAGSQGPGPSSAGGTTPNEPPVQEFLSSGRTGRRNALPDILGQHAVVTSSDLPSRLQALSTKDLGGSPSSPNEPQPGPSSAKS